MSNGCLIHRARIIIGGVASSRGTNDRVYINTAAKEVVDVDYLKVFANREAAERWFEENDPEGVAFEYEVLE
jgi:hypothetical protein